MSFMKLPMKSPKNGSAIFAGAHHIRKRIAVFRAPRCEATSARIASIDVLGRVNEAGHVPGLRFFAILDGGDIRDLRPACGISIRLRILSAYTRGSDPDRSGASVRRGMTTR